MLKFGHGMKLAVWSMAVWLSAAATHADTPNHAMSLSYLTRLAEHRLQTVPPFPVLRRGVHLWHEAVILTHLHAMAHRAPDVLIAELGMIGNTIARLENVDSHTTNPPYTTALPACCAKVDGRERTLRSWENASGQLHQLALHTQE